MFKNIGAKIKGLAICLFIIEIIFGEILGIVLFVIGSSTSGGGAFIAIGTILMLVTPLVAYVSVMLLYGFGELVENSTILAAKQAGGATPVAQSAPTWTPSLTPTKTTDSRPRSDGASMTNTVYPLHKKR